MIRVLNKEEIDILKNLSIKYLQTEDLTQTSIEVELITELAVVYWVYQPGQEVGTKITIPWFEFALSILAPVMFRSKTFKFNGIISKCILRPPETQENLLKSFAAFDEELQKKQIRKKKDKAVKKKTDEKVKADSI